MEIGARPRGKYWEPVAIDAQLGEFYLTETDEIEMLEGEGCWSLCRWLMFMSGLIVQSRHE